MDSESIYTLLVSKACNEFYVRRYVKFIISCLAQDKQYKEQEVHHFLPKSLFPNYKNLTENPWNKCILSSRQHFICHWMLAKAFSGKMGYAFWAMCNHQTKTHAYKRSYRITSLSYSSARNTQRKLVSNLRTGRMAITDGTSTKWVYPKDLIPEGWTKGVPDTLGRQVKQAMSNSIWITDGKTSTRINKFAKIPHGWKPGRINKSNKINKFHTCTDLVSKKRFRHSKDLPLKDFCTNNAEQKYVFELSIGGIIYCHTNQTVFHELLKSAIGCQLDISPTRIDYDKPRNAKCKYFPNQALSDLGLSYQLVSEFKLSSKHRWFKPLAHVG